MRKAITAKPQGRRLRASNSKVRPLPSGAHAKRLPHPLAFLVDDEALLLDLAEFSLQPAKIRVRKFLDPVQAWQAFRRARSKPRLLISDYAMGKMNGLQLIQKCKAAHPPLKTILVSGNVGAEAILNGAVKVDHFLAKPYPPERLCALAQEALDQP